MTKIEWIRQATTEEVAEFLCRMFLLVMDPALREKIIKEKYEKELVLWLNERHNE